MRQHPSRGYTQVKIPPQPDPTPSTQPSQALRLHNLVGESGSFRNSMSFTGHTKAVARATYGLTTRLIYSCSRDTNIRQWNRSGSTALRVFEGHDMACTALALSAGLALHQRIGTVAQNTLNSANGRKRLS